MQGLRGSCPPQETSQKKSVDEAITLSKYEFHKPFGPTKPATVTKHVLSIVAETF